MSISVWRGTGMSGGYQTFQVPVQTNQTILDAVSWIQQQADPTLSYRFACRVGMCGSCAMMVNGTPRWTCRTRVSKVLKDSRLKIGPLRNLPVIKDLVTDMDPFFDKWTRAEGRHHPSRTRHAPPQRVDPAAAPRRLADAAIECINCAICYAACDTVAGAPDYLGPAALQRAWTLLNDERDGGGASILAAVSGQGGCHNCHSQGGCSTHCPNELDPMVSIAGLKRVTARQFLKGR